MKDIGVAEMLGARSAEDAIYNLEKRPRLADVVLLDFALPGMSGLKFLEKLREKSSSKILQRLPVIVITGETDPRLFQKMTTLKISGFLQKPVSREALVNALEKALRRELIPEAILQGELERAGGAHAEGNTSVVSLVEDEHVADPPQIEEKGDLKDKGVDFTT